VPVGFEPPEYLLPFADRLMRNYHPLLSQNILDHPQAEWKPELQPDSVGDDFRWISVAMIERGFV